MKNLTLKEILKITPLEIQNKVAQEYYIDYSVALQMANNCKTVKECNRVLDKRYVSSLWNSSTINSVAEIFV